MTQAYPSNYKAMEQVMQHALSTPNHGVLDRSQNYAFIWHLVAFHFICITFAFHLHFA